MVGVLDILFSVAALLTLNAAFIIIAFFLRFLVNGSVFKDRANGGELQPPSPPSAWISPMKAGATAGVWSVAPRLRKLAPVECLS